MTEIIKDDILGELEWDEDYDAWIGQLISATNKKVRVKIGVDEKEVDIPLGIKKNFQFIKENELMLKNKVAKPVAELYNETWSEGDKVTEEQVAQRISLEYVSFFSNEGEAELFYSDDDLFAGHTITVFLEPSGEILEPNLAG